VAHLAEGPRADSLFQRAAAFAGSPEQVDQFVADLAETSRQAGQPFSTAAARRDYVAGPDGLLHLRFDADRLVALHRAVAQQGPPPLEVYERIRCPILLVLAARGRYRREVIEGVQARYPRLQLRWIDCGHDVPTESPAELAALLAAFIDSR
jgi:pimeloyl-ACP methyl ester carboxylesterase